MHETSSGDAFKYIIEPAKIDLPFTIDVYKKLKILDIACGRVHSAILTNYGVVTFGIIFKFLFLKFDSNSI